jgi:hypothetical protein
MAEQEHNDDRAASSDSASIRCSSCGARIGGRSGCHAAFDELVAKAWESPSRAAVHNLLVDTYAMQHTEEYGRSAKSFIAHLVGLCCGVEASAEQELYWAISRWLDGPARVTRPVDIDSRGKTTIDDVREPANEADYPELVRKWARDVWAAYTDQHAMAREWLAAVRLEMLHSGPRVSAVVDRRHNIRLHPTPPASLARRSRRG